MTDEEMLAKGVTSLPGSLREAVDHLEKSELMREILGDHLHGALVENKKAEWDAYRTQVTEWEIERYLPIL
jgi:glutamine synthetase